MSLILIELSFFLTLPCCIRTTLSSFWQSHFLIFGSHCSEFWISHNPLHVFPFSCSLRSRGWTPAASWALRRSPMPAWSRATHPPRRFQLRPYPLPRPRPLAIRWRPSRAARPPPQPAMAKRATAAFLLRSAWLSGVLAIPKHRVSVCLIVHCTPPLVFDSA